MDRTRRAASVLFQGLVLALALLPEARAERQEGAEPAVRLFRLVTMKGDVLVGLTAAEVEALGTGPEVERIARRIAEAGRITAWRYQVVRAPDGTTRLAARERVAVMRQDALMVEPYAPALPVVSPPG